MDRDQGRSDAGASRGPRLTAILRHKVLPVAKRFGKWIGLGLLAWVAVCALVVSSIEVRCRGKGGPAEAQVAVPAGLLDYARPEDETYLSYPEWYIVWSYQEKAEYQRTHLPGGFPYFSAVGQYWTSYCGMNRVVQGKFPFSPGTHLMLVVIGTSFTVEYALKSLYENTVGRVTAFMSGGQPSEEDEYAYKVAQDYADFVLVRPFYEYSFAKQLGGLWRETSWFGPHMVRKWERKLFLTYDYAVEAFYCELIEIATRAIFGVAGSETYATLEHAADSVFAANPHIKVVQPLGNRAYVVIIPRYHEFTPTSLRLARQGVQYRDIAGNAWVAVSIVGPRAAADSLAPAQLLFSDPVVIHPDRQRIVIRAPVASLNTFLLKLERTGYTIEHIYDF